MDGFSRLTTALNAPHPTAALRDLDGEGALTVLLPALEAGRGFVQPELHYYDVLGHLFATVEALDELTGAGAVARELREELTLVDIPASLDRTVGTLPLPALLRLTALVHDIAKPATAVQVDGRLRFPRHGPRGAEMLAARLPAIGFGTDETAFVTTLVRYHLRPGELVKSFPPTDRAIRKFIADLDGHVLPLLLLQFADGMAVQGPRYTREHFRRHCRFVEYVLARVLAVTEEEEGPLLTGADLLTELGLGGGRLVGAVLTSVRRAQAEGAISTRAEALVLARETLAGLGPVD